MSGLWCTVILGANWEARLNEKDVLDGDIYGMIAPYATANLWWWPYKRKFHHRYYDVVPANSTAQQGFQNTFSVTQLEATAAITMLNSGKYLATSNMLAEEIFFWAMVRAGHLQYG